MNKKEAMAMIAVTIILIAAGCAPRLTAKRITPDQNFQMQALAVSYTDSYFQPRFQMFWPSHVPTNWHGPGSYDARKAARLGSGNAFEKILGNFDVFEYFNDQFKLRANDSTKVKLNFAVLADVAPRIIALAKCDSKSACEQDIQYVSQTTTHFAAFKVSYGLAMRNGPEQFGFRKVYRPFIRVLGVIKNSATEKVIWQADMTMYSPSDTYTGGEADAENLSAERLIGSYQHITKILCDLLVDSLNGGRPAFTLTFPQAYPGELGF
jgi:hypothetical protein